MNLLDRILDPAILGVLIPIVAIVTFGAVIVSRHWFRHRERMAMIEAGLHPDVPGAQEAEVASEQVELELRERRNATRSDPRGH